MKAKPGHPANEAGGKTGARVKKPTQQAGLKKPHHKPTSESRAQVEALAGYGVRQDEIALYLDIDPKTLRSHYREQLDKGVVKANVSVARSLHKQAVEGNVAAAIFWLKSRAGFREKQEVEVTGVAGGPVVNLTLAQGHASGDGGNNG